MMLYEKGSSKAMLTNLACVSAAVSKACFWTQFREKYFGCLKPFGGHLKKSIESVGKRALQRLQTFGIDLFRGQGDSLDSVGSKLQDWGLSTVPKYLQWKWNRVHPRLKGSRPGESYLRGRPDFWLDRFLPENC